MIDLHDQSIHFVGILSSSMASLAMAARRAGAGVSGSDDHADTLYTPVLESAGVRLFDMFAQTNIHKVDTVVLSRFFDLRHTEVMAAEKLGIPVVHETDFTKTLIADRNTVAVLGPYDGPLITTWLSHVWQQAHMSADTLCHTVTDASPLARISDTTRMLISLEGMKRDAGTYEPDFLSFSASTVIIPSIMYDYPELYMTLDDVYQAYYTFVKRIPRQGLIIGNSDWSRMKRLRTHLADRHIEAYGQERDAGWQIYDVTEGESTTMFYLKQNRQVIGPFSIPCRGRLFVYAAASVVVASLAQDLSPELIGRGLKDVPHVRRYFDVTHDRQGRPIIDDCADHPSTIEDVLLNVKALYPGKKIWCLYQSGSYLRSKSLQNDFEESLGMADFVYVADIKGQPKEKSEGLHAKHLVANLRQRHPQTYYFENEADMASLLHDRVTTQDCIVTVGAHGICQAVTARLTAPVADPQEAPVIS